MMYGWGNGGWGVGMWIVMAVVMAVFWAIVVDAVVVLVRHFGHSHAAPTPVDIDAEAILRARLARGEIDEDEFQRKLAVLRQPK